MDTETYVAKNFGYIRDKNDERQKVYYIYSADGDFIEIIPKIELVGWPGNHEIIFGQH